MKSLNKILNNYCEDVLNGNNHCKWVKLSVARYKEDLKRTDIYFCEKTVLKKLNFISNLKFTEGEWAGQAFELQPWQIFIISNIFGWKKTNGLRRYKHVSLAIPRKNAKSTLSAAIVNSFIFTENLHNAQVYSIATTLNQASIVFKQAVRQIKKSDELAPLCKIQDSINNAQILYKETGTICKPLAWNPDKYDGLSPNLIVVDEYHAHRNNLQVDVFETASGSVLEPLILKISTEGFGGENSPWSKHRQYCESVLDGSLVDDSLFSMIFTIDNFDEWCKIESVQKANPNFGVSIYKENMEVKLNEAMNSSLKENQFKTKYLNIASTAENAWISDVDYNLSDSKFDTNILIGADCYLGIDLASRSDFCSINFKFKIDGVFYNVSKHYLPESALEYVDANMRSIYLDWHSKGFINITEGNMTDYNLILEDIIKSMGFYNVKNIGYDIYNSSHFINELRTKTGRDIKDFIPVSMAITTLSEPTKELEVDFKNKLNKHNLNPVMRWMYSNVSLVISAEGNCKPSKKNGAKIDGVVAELISKCLFMNNEFEESPIIWTPTFF